MTYVIGPPNYATLATAMLAGVKEHARVDFNDDDESVKRYIRWSLAYIENELDWRVAGADVVWTPVLVAGVSRYQTPLQPVSGFKAERGAVDVSAEYELIYISPLTPPWLSHKDGSDFPAGDVLTLTAGYTTPDTMPPNVEASIYRMAATLYANRESITSLNLDTTPLWLRDLLSGAWIPRA